MTKKLTIDILKDEAKNFCKDESTIDNKQLYGITDGKAIGTYIEHKFQQLLISKYEISVSSSSSGIDFPSEDILTDIKVTSFTHPQSSCPFKNAQQKIYGLGYNLLLFIYDKIDNPIDQSSKLNFVNCSFISKERTADYTITYRIREMIKDNANIEDIISYLNDRNIPADEIGITQLAKQILETPPLQGYLTISNALQWRLQYQRVVSLVEQVDGIDKLINIVKKK